MLILNELNMKRLVYFHIIFVLCMGFLINNLKLPSYISYLLIIFLLIEVAYSARYYIKIVSATNLWLVFMVILLLLGSTIVSYLLNSYPIFQYLYGFRNAMLYFLFFLSCLVILDKSDLDKIFNLLYKFLLINTVVCTYQYFVLRDTGDFCNGLFGSVKANGWMNILLCIVTAYAFSRYINNLFQFKKLLLIGAASLYISVLAQIKFYYFELIFIVVFVVILSRPSRKIFMMIISCIVFLVAIGYATAKLWPEYAKFFTKEGIESYFTQDDYGYASTVDIGRVNGISKINQIIFPNDQSTNLIGMGLGSCDMKSPFYDKYVYLHYAYFTYLITYLELGWIGLILYIIFFISIFIYSLLSSHKSQLREDISNHTIVQTMAILSIILMWYNMTVRNTPAYLLFLILSFSAVVCKPVREQSSEHWSLSFIKVRV